MCDVFNTYTQTLTLNKATVKTMNGSEYLVTPITLIVEGVLNGSQGAIYYPLSEMASNPSDWDGMPLTLNHPNVDGRFVSARQVEVLNKVGLGQIFNTRIEGNKLVAEGWFHKGLVQSIYPQLLNNLLKGIPTEVSTGLIPTLQKVAGNFNGISYQAIATNFRPDHLAVLPNDKGACSIKDGCGIFNKVTSEPIKLSCKESNLMLTKEQKSKKVDFIVANCSAWKEEDKETLTNLSDEQIIRLETDVQNKSGNQEEDKKPQAMTPEQVEAIVNKAIERVSNSSPEEKQEEKKEEKVNNKEEKEETKVPTLNEWFASAPPEVQKVFNSAQEVMNKEKAALIAKLTANVADDQKEALINSLADRDNADLELMASLLPEEKQEQQPVSNADQVKRFIGAGVGQPLNNSQAKQTGKPLMPMILNYNEEDK